MSGSTRSSADLDVRRRRNLFRAWHRGIREMDLIMGRFADAEIGTLSEEDLSEFERLIEVPDADLYRWISGEAEVPGITTRLSSGASNVSTGTRRRSTAEPSAPSKRSRAGDAARFDRIALSTMTIMKAAPLRAADALDRGEAVTLAACRTVSTASSSPTLPAASPPRRRGRPRSCMSPATASASRRSRMRLPSSRRRSRSWPSRPGTASPTTASRRTRRSPRSA